jgi:hypothetical protein
VTLAYGRARSDSEATLSEAATVQAGDVFVTANNQNEFNVLTGSKILFPSKNFGQGLSVSVSDVGSESNATVAGTISARSRRSMPSRSTSPTPTRPPCTSGTRFRLPASWAR